MTSDRSNPSHKIFKKKRFDYREEKRNKNNLLNFQTENVNPEI